MRDAASAYLIASLCMVLASCSGGGASSSSSMAGSSATYAVGGTIAGLSASGLVLADNSSDTLAVISGATSFSFNGALTNGSTYAVSISQQPNGQTCAVGNGSG